MTMAGYRGGSRRDQGGRRRPLQRYGASVADARARGADPCRPVVTYSDSPGAPR
jgi:hypothetical protein